jgi:hypothetical protein
MMNACNPSNEEAEAGGLQVQSQRGLRIEFQTRLNDIVSPCLKKNKC